MSWKKLSKPIIRNRVFAALAENRNYYSDDILGIPGTYLDTEQFYRDADFLQDAPYLTTLINNPNHIGCHTLTGEEGEDLFHGTQKLEIELMRLVSEEILRAEPNGIDGYVAPGGTEANLEAMWIYRNYYRQEYGANNEEIGVVFSSDSHYSFHKGCNLLSTKPLQVEVDYNTRQMKPAALKETLDQATANGVKHLIVIANMSTTMFGSVDDLEIILPIVRESGLEYKIHVDGAFGGFIYPFTNPNNQLDFANPEITSVTLDAHKMLMAPYGTGIFLIRKGWMHYAATDEAKYVQGLDYTICGSRNGAQAVSIWMILHTHGPNGWRQNIHSLMNETDRLCNALDERGITYFRNPMMNIISIHAGQIPEDISKKYRLVADNFADPGWWKIVVMPHSMGKVVDRFIHDLNQPLGFNKP